MPLPSTQQYAPWLTDPDPPLKSMTPEQSKAAAKGVAKLMGIKPPAEEEARAKERKLFARMRRVKAWPMAPDPARDPDDKA
jgi:hypothetical protein